MKGENKLALQKAIEKRCPTASSPKVTRYISKFWDRSLRERKITAVSDPNSLKAYLDGITLAELTNNKPSFRKADDANPTII